MVDELENHVKNFKPATYDVSKQIKGIEAYEAAAVKSAEETKGMVEKELRSLEKTLANIEEARPFNELSLVSKFLDFGWFYRLVLEASIFRNAGRSKTKADLFIG